MRGLRRRSNRPSNVAAPVKPAPAALPGRFTDQLLQCETCGRPFVFTVEEQRQLADTGEEMLAPTQCPRCAPREQRADEGRKTEDVRPKTEDVRVKTERAVMEPARGRTQVARHQAPLTSHQSLDEEFDIRFTVRQYGHVKSWDTQKGQGTIVDDDTGEVYPVYQSGLEGGTRHLAPGQAVEFELDGNPRRPEAVLVIVL